MPDYNDSVFINCPFDKKYAPLLRAIVFTIYRCGFYPITALFEDDGTDNRLGKIERLIENCRYGVHDICRTELDTKTRLPRFNMPFELGIFFGAKRFGNDKQRNKVAIIFDRSQYRYLKFISDLNGVDIRTHKNSPKIAIQKIRNWLKTSSRRSTIPGDVTIIKEYQTFSRKLPRIVQKLGLDINDLSFNDYCLIVEETIKAVG